MVVSAQTGQCKAGRAAFASSGRISADFQTITIVDRRPALDLSLCAWGAVRDVVTVLTRERQGEGGTGG